MMKRYTLLFLALMLCPILSFGQIGGDFSEKEERKAYYTQRITGTAPHIDGKIDDKAWDAADWTGNFTQRSPADGAQPMQPTVFKIIYDDRNLYIAWRCYDSAPDSIVQRMSRRDGFEGDWVEINLDSYYDQRTAFSFTASVSGVRNDELVSNDGNNWDPSWNPVWYLKTQVDSLGWTAEARIPFNQLRFPDKAEQVWGIQVTRRNFRHASHSVWQYIPQNSGYWVSGFGELRGLKNIKPPRRIELQPYIVARAERFQAEAGNPYEDGSREVLTAGLDGKVGITSDLTVDFTINPDFGQVEADPSAININGFQIFFREQRPFFVESQNIFEYPINGGGNGDLVFYSRRIGAQPHRRFSSDASENYFVSQPQNTTILGAAKFSGKTRKGLSVGVLESVTEREVARINDNGEEREEVVEPLTNFLVGRVMQDFNQGNTIIGGMLTSTNRFWEGDQFDNELHRDAYSGGIDFLHRWKNQTWKVEGSFMASRVEGTPEMLINTQTAFEHLFQRPDAEHLEIDSSATSLSGYGGNFEFGKVRGNFTFATGVNWRSPRLELNDIGFLTQTDLINQYLFARYQINQPDGLFRNYATTFNHRLRWNFAGEHLHQSARVGFNAEFQNFWGINLGLNREFKDISQNALFGGPSIRRPNGTSISFSFYTDNRKAVSFWGSTSNVWGTDNGIRIWSYEGGIDMRPIDALRIFLSPSIRTFQRPVQYVSKADFQGQTRYIAGTVDQRTLSLTMRLNYNITPDLTLQFYGQPFISRGRYTNFKYIDNPRSTELRERFIPYAPEQISFEEGNYFVDEGAEGEADYSFGDPDFSFIQFRSNLVARWEYIPGSEIFLVWSQGTTTAGDPQGELFESLSNNLLSEASRHNFVIKVTYRFYR